MTKTKKVLSKWVFIAIYSAVILGCIALDQLTKVLVEAAVKQNGRISIIGDWLTLTWTLNTGATGGLFSNLAWRNWLFFVMTLLGLPIFGFMLWRSRTRSVWGQIAFSFVIGGTIGNAIDRIVFAQNGFFTGGVRDFIQVEGFFGIFNIADSFLVVGVIMAVLAIVFFDPDGLLATIRAEKSQKGATDSATDGVATSDGATQPADDSQQTETTSLQEPSDVTEQDK